MKTLRAALGAVFLWAALVPPAQAQMACNKRAVVVENLAKKYGETRRIAGLTQDGKALIEFWASPEGSWTATRSTPDGVTCIVAAGSDWLEMPAPVADGPEL